MAALVVVALALLAPVAAFADGTGAVPDAAQMAMLREAVARSNGLRVRGDFGLRKVYYAKLDSTGIRSAFAEGRPRPALFVDKDAPDTPASAVIPWSEISTLETHRPKKLQGAIGGFVVGLAIGLTLALNYEGKYSEDYTGIGLLIGPPFYGLIGGTILGSLSGNKVIYRAPTQENH